MVRLRGRARLAVSTFLLLAVLIPSLALAQDRVQFGVRADAWLEDSDPGIGVDALIPFGHQGWAFDPNAEVVFGGDRDRWVVNLDVQRALRVDEGIAWYAGVGGAWIHRDSDLRHRAQNDPGLNLFGGATWRWNGVTPFAQLKVVASDDSELVASVGVRF